MSFCNVEVCVIGMNWASSWLLAVLASIAAGGSVAVATRGLRLRHHDSGSLEKTAAAAAEHAPGGLQQVDSEGVIVWANRAELEMIGWSHDEYIGKNAAEFYADPSEGAGIFARIASGEAVRDHRATLRARDGSLKNVLVNSNADIVNGRLVHAWLLKQEVAGQKLAEDEILRLNQELEKRVRQRTAQLEATTKEMESFSYSVSHDLRAPLRSMRGFTEALLEGHASQLDSRGQDFLQRACAASLQMERLIEDLLKLAQISRSELQLEDVNLSLLAKEIAAELVIGDSTRTVEFVIAPECMARADARLIRLALDNLMRNSWKFSGKRAEAHIEFGRNDEKEPVFFVRDNGAGFNMEYSGKLFGVFQRLHSPKEFPGTGIGLATVKRIITRHGGRVWAEGGVDQGATFYFTLPNSNIENHAAAPEP
jgi:PAS domain S-box-containing protein